MLRPFSLTWFAGVVGKDDDDWTTKDTQWERKESALMMIPKKWRKNVGKMSSFFFASSFLPSLFTFTFWTRMGELKSTLTQPY